MFTLVLNENYQIEIFSYLVNFHSDENLYIEVSFNSNKEFNILREELALYFTGELLIKDIDNDIIFQILDCKLNMVQRNLDEPTVFTLEFFKIGQNDILLLLKNRGSQLIKQKDINFYIKENDPCICFNDKKIKILSCCEQFQFGRENIHRVIYSIPFSTYTAEFLNTDFYIINKNNQEFYFTNLQIEDVMEEADHYSVKMIKVD